MPSTRFVLTYTPRGARVSFTSTWSRSVQSRAWIGLIDGRSTTRWQSGSEPTRTSPTTSSTSRRPAVEAAAQNGERREAQLLP